MFYYQVIVLYQGIDVISLKIFLKNVGIIPLHKILFLGVLYDTNRSRSFVSSNIHVHTDIYESISIV